MKYFFQILDKQAVPIMKPEKRNQKGVIYDYLDFLSGGNFQATMQARLSEFFELKRQSSERLNS